VNYFCRTLGIEFDCGLYLVIPEVCCLSQAAKAKLKLKNLVRLITAEKKPGSRLTDEKIIYE